MPLGDLLPLLTGSGGAIVAMAFGYFLILSGKLVTGREHDRLLSAYQKAEEANDTLAASLAAARENNASLLNSGQLTTGLLSALNALASQKGANSPSTGP